jgi:hypothetical protein
MPAAPVEGKMLVCALAATKKKTAIKSKMCFIWQVFNNKR